MGSKDGETNQPHIVPSLLLDPFLWADLQMAKIPFSDDIIFVVLDKLKNDDWVEDLVADLKNLFKVGSVWQGFSWYKLQDFTTPQHTGSQ